MAVPSTQEEALLPMVIPSLETTDILGGGIFTLPHTTATISNCIFVDNTAAEGVPLATWEP